MRTNTLARVAMICFAVVGVAFLVAALLVAVRPIEVHVKGRTFKCGSVLSSKDPRDIVSSRAQVKPLFKQANARCNKKRSEQTHTAIRYLVIGAVPVLIALMIPAIGRRSRMARAHRRTRL
jgi:hypothetical protein